MISMEDDFLGITDNVFCTETTESENNLLKKEVNEVFSNLRDINYYTANTAQDVIVNADRLGITAEEYLEIVGSYLKNFEKKKGGKTNVKDS